MSSDSDTDNIEKKEKKLSESGSSNLPDSEVTHSTEHNRLSLRDSNITPETSRSGSRPTSPALNAIFGTSPVQYVDFDCLIKATDTFTNLSLAHEISINEEFRLEKQELPENSLEKKVRDIMMTAFWDVLRNKLNSDPPNYDQALVLLQEIKEILLSFLTPQNKRLKQHIEEHLDLELIKQQLEHGALDLGKYASYVIDTMAKMCAPVRDEEVAHLRDIKDPVELYQQIFRILDNMKMDMANFTIAQMRPYIQLNAVEYERNKFIEYLEAQKRIGVDGLEETRQWLTASYHRLATQLESSTFSAASSSTTSSQGDVVSVTPFNILISASLEILDWPDHRPYPETLQVDENRLRTLREAVHHIILTASLVLIAGSMLHERRSNAQIQNLKQMMKKHVVALMRDVLTVDFVKHTESLADQVVKDVNQFLEEGQHALLSQEEETSLRKQVDDVAKGSNAVATLLRGRLYEFIKHTCFPTSNHKQALPLGFSVFETEISETCGHLMRLFAYNRSVFGPIYAEILQPLIKPHDISPANTPR